MIYRQISTNRWGSVNVSITATPHYVNGAEFQELLMLEWATTVLFGWGGLSIYESSQTIYSILYALVYWQTNSVSSTAEAMKISILFFYMLINAIHPKGVTLTDCLHQEATFVCSNIGFPIWRHSYWFHNKFSNNTSANNRGSCRFALESLTGVLYWRRKTGISC